MPNKKQCKIPKAKRFYKQMTKNEFGNKEQYLDSSFGFLWKNTIPYSYEEINSEGKVHVSSQTDNPK